MHKIFGIIAKEQSLPPPHLGLLPGEQLPLQPDLLLVGRPRINQGGRANYMSGWIDKCATKSLYRLCLCLFSCWPMAMPCLFILYGQKGLMGLWQLCSALRTLTRWPIELSCTAENTIQSIQWLHRQESTVWIWYQRCTIMTELLNLSTIQGVKTWRWPFCFKTLNLVDRRIFFRNNWSHRTLLSFTAS